MNHNKYDKLITIILRLSINQLHTSYSLLIFIDIQFTFRCLLNNRI